VSNVEYIDVWTSG